MANRRMQDSDYIYDKDDDLLGLTSAFPAVKGPQSVEYDKGDEAIGLTGAFAPIVLEADEKPWDEGGKWSDFDWEAYRSEIDEEPVAEPADESANEPAPDADKSETTESSGQQAAHAGQAAKSASGGSGRGRHAAPDATMSPRMQQARKKRRTLIIVLILLVVVIGVVAFFTFRTFSNSQEEAHQAEQEQAEAPKESLASAPADDADDSPAKLTDVPKLTSLFGMTADEAVKAIGHGAMALPAREVKEEGNPVKSSVNVSLNDEPVDSKTGAPMVYLGLDQDGKVIQIGYSASAAALGFGSLSFADAVNNEHVIEKTLAKIGVTIPEGSAVLPADKSAYSTYGSDGKTVTRERCSFEGDVDVNGAPCVWSAVLSYDYTTQVVTGDLSDTVRVIYVYITKK